MGMRTGEMAGLVKMLAVQARRFKTPVRARLGQHLQPQASYSKIGGRELEKDGSAVESVYRLLWRASVIYVGQLTTTCNSSSRGIQLL